MTSVYVFDAYGTLFDVHAAIARHRAAAGAEADRFSEIWRTKQLEYTWTLTLAGRYVDFWTLTEQALSFAFARVPSVDRALKSKLLDAYLALDPFADAAAALTDLKSRGNRLAILSNGTPRMLASAIDAAGFSGLFDALVTDTFAVTPAEVIFVSSNRWDVMGATAFGFKAAWVNRARMPDEYRELAPLREIAGLAALESGD
jgi:2-haloacid dehalogenase